MKMHTWIHRLAIAALCGMAILNVSSFFRGAQAYPLHIVVATILAWILIIRGISIYPRQWGLWIGLFLLGSVFFQIYLWNLARDRAAMLHLPPELAPSFWLFFTSEILTGSAALLCLLLRLRPRAASNGSARLS